MNFIQKALFWAVEGEDICFIFNFTAAPEGEIEYWTQRFIGHFERKKQLTSVMGNFLNLHFKKKLAV